MNISSPSASPQRLSLMTTQPLPPPETREVAGRDTIKDNDADDAVTNNARAALERPTPPPPSNRAPLAEAAGKLVDKLI